MTMPETHRPELGAAMTPPPTPFRNLKEYLLRIMVERVHDPDRPRKNPWQGYQGTRDKADLHIGWSVVELTLMAREQFKRGISVHEVVHVLYDLQKLDLVRFNTTKAKSAVAELKRVGGIGPSAGNGIPIRIRLSPKSAALDPAKAAFELRTKEMESVTKEIDDEAIVEDILDEGRRARAGKRLNGTSFTMVVPAQIMREAVAREAAASVALDHDEHEGTHFIGDGHPAHEGGAVTAKPSEVEAPAPPEPAPPPPGPKPDPVYAESALGLAAGTVQQIAEKIAGNPKINAMEPYPLWLMGAKYPLLATAMNAEQRVAEAVRLLRMAGQNTVADMAAEELAKRSPLELEAVAFINELVQWGLAEREEGAIDKP